MSGLPLIEPDWPAPPGVRAATTTRLGGCSEPPYDSLNLGDHVGDDAQAVAANRARLRAALRLPGEPLWLRQVHGDWVCEAAAGACEGDARIVRGAGQVAVVLTADCLPVLFTSRDGAELAAAHAGWRGLAAGVLERTVAAFTAEPGALMAWLGPAIGPRAFEVGDEVRDAFLAHEARAAEAFRPVREGHWLCDLYRLARQRLETAGVDAIYGGGLCTYSDPARFYSHRRDGRTGRMASLIWREETP